MMGLVVVVCVHMCAYVCECWGWYGSFQCQPLYVSMGGNMSFLTAPGVAAHVFIHSVSSQHDAPECVLFEPLDW